MNSCTNCPSTKTVKVNCQKDKRLAVEKKVKQNIKYNQHKKDTWINSEEINDILNIGYDFSNRKKDTYVNSNGIILMLNIPQQKL